MSSSSQTHEFYVGQIVIGKSDDDQLGINGSKYLWRNKPLSVSRTGLGFERNLIEVDNGLGKGQWYSWRFVPYKPRDMKDFA